MSVNLNRALVFDGSMPKKDPVSQCSILKNAISVQSVPEMIDKLKQTNKIFDVITLSGHGCPGAHGVGSGLSSGYTPKKDLTAGHLNDVKTELLELRKLMYNPRSPNDRYPVLFVGGCLVGELDETTDEAELLKELSKIMQKVCVIGCAIEVAPMKLKNKAIEFQTADNHGKPRGPLELFRCSVYIDGERLDSTDDILEATGYTDYEKFIQNITYWTE